MSLDEDVTLAIAALDDIRAIVVQIPHEERKEITDKVLAFRDSLMKPASLAEEYIKYVGDPANENKTFDDFFDHVKVPEEERNDFVIAAMFKQVKEIQEQT